MRVFVSALMLLSATALGPVGSSSGAQVGPSSPNVETVVTGLDTVWELAWGEEGRLYLAERAGRVSVWDGEKLQVLGSLPVVESGESGLMGMALDPDFPQSPSLYVCYTHDENGPLENRVERLRLDDDQLVRDGILLDGMDGASIHDGCRLGFGPAGALFVTMGDAGNAAAAQDRESLNGKVLRVHPDGSIPEDNPFPGSPVFTLGHRNPQGLDIRPGTDDVYISEHGPDTDDEINRLIPGGNYGWPEVLGTEEVSGFEPALWSWTPTIAPADIAFLDAATLYLNTLKASELHRLTLDREGRIVADEVVLEGFGRLRSMAMGPDGRCLYIGTSNRDGRGRPRGDDDRVLQFCPNS